MKKISLLITFTLALLLAGCPEENELLVNPEPITKSVRIRVLNLSRFGSPLSFRFDGEVETEAIGYGELTRLIVPPDIAPYDSLLFEAIGPDGNTEFIPSRRPRLFRNVDYTYIVLPSTKEDSIQAEIRRLLLTQTTPALPENNTNAYLKIISGVDQEGFSVSVRDGCQSGQELNISAGLGLISSARELPSGERIVSLVAITDDGAVGIGTYTINLTEQGQYILLVLEAPESPTGYDILLLDEQDENSILTELVPMKGNALSIRIANLGIEPINMRFNSMENPFGTISENSMTEYRSFGACQSIFPDTVEISLLSGMSSSSFTTQLNVGENYTIVNLEDYRELDEEGKPLLTPLLVEPLDLTYVKQTGYSTVRVINGISTDIGITLSVASNSEQTGNAPSGTLDEETLSRNFLAGKAIASSLSFGEISPATEILPGRLPITLFTSAQPAQFLDGYINEFLPDKEYICLVYGTIEEPKLSIISDETPGGQLTLPLTGTIVQIVNAKPSAELLPIEMSSATGYTPLSQARIAYTNSVGTVLPEGTANISIDGQTISSDVLKTNRLLVVATGNGLITENKPKMSYEGRAFATRFIHAAASAPGILIKDSEEAEPYFDPMVFGESSDDLILDIATSFAFYFYNSDNDELIATAQDIALNYYKSYYLIFAGEQSAETENNGYSLIVAQEF